MILAAVIGYPASGKTTLLNQFASTEWEAMPTMVLTKRVEKENDVLRLIREITEAERNSIPVVLFEAIYSDRLHHRLSILFPKAEWLLVWVGTPVQVCANRLALEYTKKAREFSSEKFFKSNYRLTEEIRHAVEQTGLRFCEITYGLSDEAAVAKLKSYLRTAAKLQREKEKVNE